MADETTARASFAQYGRDFQEKIMQGFLTDKRWAEQMSEVFRTEYFDLKYLKYLSERYFEFSKKYKQFPSLNLLVTIVSDDLKSAGTDGVLRSQVIDYLKRTHAGIDMGDLPFVKEKALDFCKRQALKEALEKSVDLINDAKYETVVDIMKRAVMLGASASVGHDFFEDHEARFVKISRAPIATGLDALDAKDILNGGLGVGELGVVMAPTGIGKSHFLTFLGANAMRNRKNVLHYTFELSETGIGLRYDSNLCDMPSNEVQDRKDEVLQHYAENKYGKLIIKEYPMHFASVNTLRSHYEKLVITKGVKPDLIIIDYADIMRSSRKYEDLRHELKLIYEELRAWASEIKTPIWTASQTNRAATESEVIGLESISEAYGKAMTSDVIITLSRKRVEKAGGWGRIYIAKNRAGRDGLLFSIKIDTARSMFTITGEENQEKLSQEEENNLKSTLRAKWESIQRDKELKVQSLGNGLEHVSAVDKPVDGTSDQ